MRRFVQVAVLLFLLLHCGCSRAADAKPTPPTQPISGPGGSTYAFAGVTQQTYGQGGEQYWIFEPDKPKPASAPVVVFNHGWSAVSPSIYGAWIGHIVRRGNIVIFPVYQESLLSPATKFTPNAIAAVKAALAELKAGTHVRPLTDRLAVVGHSAGGLISANMAALAASSSLPQFKAVMCVEPGKTGGRANFVLADLKTIPKTTLLLSIAGEDDSMVGSEDAKKIFEGATTVLAANKNLTTLRSDSYGSPALSADHLAPCAGDASFLADGTKALRGVDAMDFVLWRLFDSLCDAAWYGKNRKLALGDTPEQRSMGKWSDGKPVKEMVVRTK